MARQVDTYEAVNSALWNMPWSEFLGETDSSLGERTAWWHFGDKPKNMRVRVIIGLDGETVRSVAEWNNYAADARNPLRGTQEFTITLTRATDAEIREGTRAVLEALLRLYKDVLEEVGVAGPIPKLDAPEEVEVV